jgi:hypothetical protein
MAMRTFENFQTFRGFLETLPAACRRAGRDGLAAGADIVHAAAAADAACTSASGETSAVVGAADPATYDPLAAAAARASGGAARAIAEAIVAALAGSEGKRP